MKVFFVFSIKKEEVLDDIYIYIFSINNQNQLLFFYIKVVQ